MIQWMVHVSWKVKKIARVVQCKYVGYNNCHELLYAEGVNKCILCASTTCKKCCVKRGENEIICLQCRWHTVLVDQKDMKSIEMKNCAIVLIGVIVIAIFLAQ